MNCYVYIQTEPRLWTVGFYDPQGVWHADSDHASREKAAERVHWLNGGGTTVIARPLIDELIGESPERMRRDQERCREIGEQQ